MDKQWNPDQIRPLLDSSLELLDEKILLSLRGARVRALSRHDACGAPLRLPSLARKHVNLYALVSNRNICNWIGVLLLVSVFLGGIAYWQLVKDKDIVDADMAILTDDLPIRYYID